MHKSKRWRRSAATLRMWRRRSCCWWPACISAGEVRSLGVKSMQKLVGVWRGWGGGMMVSGPITMSAPEVEVGAINPDLMASGGRD